MRETELRPFGYICAVDRVVPLLKHGILSRQRADERGIHVHDISDAGVQRRRQRKGLHRFANLYFNPRNAMLYREIRTPGLHEIAILEVNPSALWLESAMIVPCNAAIGDGLDARPAFEGLPILEAEEVYCRNWSDPDPDLENRRKRAMMAELLVPDAIPATFINQVRVATKEPRDRVADVIDVPVQVDPDGFFEVR